MEDKFPLYFAWSKTRVGSDHWPIFLDIGESPENRQMHIYFEKEWLLDERFEERLQNNWNNNKSKHTDQRYSLDI
jgi:hypothetical protein